MLIMIWILKRHHIGAIRDEDFLCYEEIDL